MAAEVQDEEQWLYGDEKEEKDKEDDEEQDKKEEGEIDGNETNEESTDRILEEKGDESDRLQGDEASRDGLTATDGGEEKKNEEDEEEDSSDDEPTVTIGKIVKQTDIVAAPQHQSRFQPKAPQTSGFKDEDFTGAGKINGVAVADFDVGELEEKPWRKPGTDLSDYFNYGFTEESWIKYCERQRRMRVDESGAGLSGLNMGSGKNYIGTGLNHVPSVLNENSKYGGTRLKPLVNYRGKLDSENDSTPNTIQVMTADKREYSAKSMMNQTYGTEVHYGMYSEPFYQHPTNIPPPFFGGPPPSYDPNLWGITHRPPPSWTAQMPPPPSSVVSMPTFLDEDSISHASPYDMHEEKSRRSRERDSRESRRHLSEYSRSRSPSHRHSRRSRSRSRSRTPSHRHKRKKSKREREID